jgi:fibronectin-binding autotransporter adhesin
VCVTAARGADLYWDGPAVNVDGQSGGGTGTWNVGVGGWEDGASAVDWTNGENAVFAGTAGTVTLGGTITAPVISVNATGYTLALANNSISSTSLNYSGAANGTLTFTGTAGATNAQNAITLNGAGTGWASGTSVALNGSTNPGVGSTQNGALLKLIFGDATALGSAELRVRHAMIQAGAAGMTITNNITNAGASLYFGGEHDFTVSGLLKNDSAAPRTVGVWVGSTASRTITLGNMDTNGQTFNFEARGSVADPNPGGGFIVNGVISGTGGISTVGATQFVGNTVTFNGANTYTGATTMASGTYKAGIASVAGVSGAFGNNSAMSISDGTVDLNGFNTQVGSLGGAGGNLILGSATLTTGGLNTSTSYGGTISSSTGGIVKTGSGAFTLTNATVAVGSISVTGGRLTLNRAGQIALNTTNIALGSNRELLIAYGTGTLGGTITMGAGSLLGIKNGNAEGNQALRSTVNTNIVLASGSSADEAASIGGFNFGNSTILTGTISGTGSLRWRNSILGEGSNSATLTAANNTSGWAANSYSGATSFEGVNLTFSLASNVNNGVVKPFGVSGNAVNITGGQLRFLQTGGTSNTTLIENNLSLSAADGATTILFREDGNLRLEGNVDIATTGSGNVRLQSHWGFANSKGLTIAGQLTGSGSLTVTRSGGEEGSVKLANNTNTYNGTITLNSSGAAAGILVLEANGSATHAKINLASSGSHLNVNTTNATIAELSGVTGSQISARSAGQVLTVNQITNTTFAGVLGGTGISGSDAGLALVKDGSGTLTLSGINTHTGPTTVNNGTLSVTGSSLADGASLTLNGGQLELTNTEMVSDLYFGASQQTRGTWGASGSGAQFIDNSRFSGTGVLNVVNGPDPEGGYGAWAATNAPAQTADEDFDNDGVSNGIEYILGGSKDTNDTGKLPVAATPGTNFTVTFTRAKASKTPDVTVRIDVGTTLASWPDSYNVATAPEVTVTSLDSNWEQITLSIPRGVTPRQFARLVVEIQ